MLVQAAFHLAGAPEQHSNMLQRAGRYVDSQGNIDGLRRRYGRDKTFAVPILTNAALAGLVPWENVSPLPFEMACLPQRFYRFVGLPVVSYAIPALVAIGQARYAHLPPRNPLMRWVRRMSVEPSLRVLERMQPESGGYLEATPLTSFVVMSLAGIGRAGHPVARRGVQFLVDSVREDGSWPIDTNLATWVTTLAVNAMAESGDDLASIDCTDWLLDCQHRQIHPFTGADPGGWAWTDLSGGVPDADDTPGALLALAALRAQATEDQRLRIDQAAIAGINWLLGLQNRDGGWPTFCRGWGKLPFDRSGVDLTAHVLRAFHRWSDTLPQHDQDTSSHHQRRRKRIARAVQRGFRFLHDRQRPDGSWIPLWFGNQDHPDEENPVYGTSRVLAAYRDFGRLGEDPAGRALDYLTASQWADGGWAGGSGGKMSSVEETALAVEALISAELTSTRQAAVETGFTWLVDAVRSGRHRESSPIGFYFARLWYYETLYPLIFTVATLGRALRRFAGVSKRETPQPRPTSSENAS